VVSEEHQFSLNPFHQLVDNWHRNISQISSFLETSPDNICRKTTSNME